MVPKPTAPTEAEGVALDALMDALGSAPPEGFTRTDLQRIAGLQRVSAATALRWLNYLIGDGWVEAHGATKARRYRLALTPNQSRPRHRDRTRGAAQRTTDAHDSARELVLPLSLVGKDLRRAVRLPLGERPPAAFERAFLDAYRPGETSYLPRAVRQHLAVLGRTEDAQQPGGTFARHVLQRLLIDLSWNSSRLEGNTYSLLDTERLVLEGREAEGKALMERQMIVNHKDAIEWMVEEASDPAPVRLRAATLRNLHALLAHNLLGDPADEGRVRARTVHIHGSTFVPLDVPQQIEECLTQIALTAAAIDDPFEQSFFLLVHIPYLQPFVDGNKRTARLAANLPFIRDNLRPLTFVDVPQESFIEAILAIYELRRVELMLDVFVWAYERSCARYAAVKKSLGEPDPFRLKHRALIKEAIAAFVRAGQPPDRAIEMVEPFAARLLAADRPRFIAVIEAELRALHDGNYARYGLRPSEFEAWAALVRAGRHE